MRPARRAIWWAVALQLLLAATPFLPSIKGIWHLETPQQFYAVLATFVGLQFALITAAFADLLQSESEDFRGAVDGLIAKVPGAIIRKLRDDEFYQVFLFAAQNAESTVRIAYLAPSPPSTIADQARNAYYRDMAALMRRKSDVKFKRLIRDSPQNTVWIAELIKEFEGKSNIDLAVLRVDLPPEREMPLSLSVQIVDDSKVWLVAVASHERDGSYRDLYIESAEAAEALTQYYTRLWNEAEELLSSGRITEAGRAIVVASTT